MAIRQVSKDSRRAMPFIEVDDLDEVISRMKGEKVLVARHTTFYNADEISYEEPVATCHFRPHHPVGPIS